MDGSVSVGEYQNGTEKIGVDGLWIPKENTEGFVNSKESPKFNTRLQFVNNRDSYVKETEQKFVNNLEGQKMENKFEDESDKFD